MPPHTAWEWLEQYGAVSLPRQVKESSHEEREKMLTGMLMESKSSEHMEGILKKLLLWQKKEQSL